jgi:hypothetical protein
MTTAEQINRHERILHALKGKAKCLKAERWVDVNYKNTQPKPLTELVEVEAQITEQRKTLKSLYETILN